MENKYYQIGELAGILNISRQMIRYYEECGVIKPERIANNNYRLYSAMDYFALGEAISLSRFGVNIKDISTLKMSDYSAQVIRHFRRFISDTKDEIGYRQLLIRRAEQQIEKTETAAMNIGNTWVKKVPEHILFPLMRSKNDVYGEIVTPDSVISQLNAGESVVFGDGLVEFNEADEFWWISLDAEYADYLKLPLSAECRRIPDQYCLCTVMDMGEIGMFDSDHVRTFADTVLSSGYIPEGKLHGLLLGRGKENEQYHRYLEVRMPVKKP